MKKVNTKKVNVHIKKDDLVKVISGQDKGKTGIVKKVERKTSKVIVAGINLKMKHIKPKKKEQIEQREKEQVEQRKELEFPIHSSNLKKVEN